MFDPKTIPHCTVDFPPDFSTEEMHVSAPAINMLLKGVCLFGQTSDSETAFQSLFDLAEEIVSIDLALCLRVKEDDINHFEPIATRNLPRSFSEEPAFEWAAHTARHYEKPVLLDPRRDPLCGPLCRPYGASSLIVIPLKRERDTIGAVIFGKRDNTAFSPVDIKLLWMLSIQGELILSQAESVRALSYYSFIDPLTHLHNRRYFDDQIEKEILRSRRNGKPFALLMIDMDGFKSYNDQFLHSAGDVALQEFAEVLRDSVREVDTVARLGGDEFAAILPESGPEGAQDLGQRIIERFRKRPLPGVSHARIERLSVSIGVASFPGDAFDRLDLVNKADRALYDAKKSGGGRVCLFSEIEGDSRGKAFLPDVPVHKLFDAARSVVDMDKFLEILLFTAMQGISATRGSIVVMSPEGNFTLRAAIGFRPEEDMEPGTSLSPGFVTSWVVEHRQPLVVSGSDDFHWDRPPRKNSYSSNSFLSIPLFHDNRMLGVLHLTNRSDAKPFARADVVSFEPLVRKVAAILAEGIAFRDNVKTFSTSILASLGSALEFKYPFLHEHHDRVSRLSRQIAEKMGLPENRIDALMTAAGLHDIGIVGIPGNILLKKRRLTVRELEIVRHHPIFGSKLLEGVPSMEEARRVILEHHENFDGSGYPYALKGEGISMCGRILGIAEYYDSLVSERPYRSRVTPSEAYRSVRNGAGTLFDPEVVRAFSSLPIDRN